MLGRRSRIHIRPCRGARWHRCGHCVEATIDTSFYDKTLLICRHVKPAQIDLGCRCRQDLEGFWCRRRGGRRLGCGYDIRCQPRRSTDDIDRSDSIGIFGRRMNLEVGPQRSVGRHPGDVGPLSVLASLNSKAAFVVCRIYPGHIDPGRRNYVDHEVCRSRRSCLGRFTRCGIGLV